MSATPAMSEPPVGPDTPQVSPWTGPARVGDPAAEQPVAAGANSAAAQVPQSANEPPPTTGGYDWDAATAAALTDESADRVAAPHVHTTTMADRLLEDIIREIVGDAAAIAVDEARDLRLGAQPLHGHERRQDARE